jgi:2,4-dienoyl-CoA reductase-like NADH-dependent reductase (Old Yellow Enzyme family)
MSKLFSKLKIREVEFRNRVFVSPMCQYSSRDGIPNDWHLVHLGSRAVGGAALVMVEATGVSATGRISPADSGIWSDAHAEAFKPIAAFIKSQGAVPGIQLAHAGRKAATDVPWRGGLGLSDAEGGWTPLASMSSPVISRGTR